MSPSAEETRAALVVLSAFAVAMSHPPVPWWLPAAFVVAAMAAMRPRLLLLAALLAIGARSHHVVGDLHPADTRPIERETVQLTADPRPDEYGWRVEAELSGDRVTIDARGTIAIELSRMSRGDRLVVTGVVRGTKITSGWTRSRGIVGRLDLARIHRVQPARGPTRWATQYRELLRTGANSLPPDQRALFTGLVFGDDREQSAVTADHFRAAGLGHLLAVSGQNVLFVLVLAAPLLGRVRSLGLRFGTTLLVLAGFGFVTRFEPSVSRALVMAGLVALASIRGAPADALRVLPIAVTGLLFVDPGFGHSLAFQLSVIATFGLVVLTPRIAPRLVGPEGIRQVVAATIGAQLAVAPLLIARFGSVSLLAVPANALVAPAAGFVMMWGLTAGTLAGIGPPGFAAMLHVPTRAAISWIELVARMVADVPVGVAGAFHVVALVTGLIGHACSRSGLGRAAFAALAAAAVTVPLLATPPLGPGQHVLAPGLTLIRSSDGHDILVLEDPPSTPRVLEELRRSRIGRIDLLVSVDGDRRAGRLVGTLTDRFPVTDIWAPAGHQIPGARVHPPAGARLGPFTVTVRGDTGVDVTVETHARANVRADADR